MLVTVAAWTLVALQSFYVLTAPFMIGRARDPRSAGDYVLGLLGAAVELVVIGRVLGWW